MADAFAHAITLHFPIGKLSDTAEGFAIMGNPYLGVTRVSSSEGCRMRQVVKVKVELVCDMHFPG